MNVNIGHGNESVNEAVRKQMQDFRDSYSKMADILICNLFATSKKRQLVEYGPNFCDLLRIIQEWKAKVNFLFCNIKND